ERFLSKHLDYDDHYQTHFEQDLAEILQDNLTEGQTEDDARRLAHRCAMNENDAVDKVNQILDDTDWDMDRILNSAKTRKAKELAKDYLQRKPGAITLIDKLLAETGASIDALMAAALPAILEYIERIDRLTTGAEARRHCTFREID